MPNRRCSSGRCCRLSCVYYPLQSHRLAGCSNHRVSATSEQYRHFQSTPALGDHPPAMEGRNEPDGPSFGRSNECTHDRERGRRITIGQIDRLEPIMKLGGLATTTRGRSRRARGARDERRDARIWMRVGVEVATGGWIDCRRVAVRVCACGSEDRYGGDCRREDTSRGRLRAVASATPSMTIGGGKTSFGEPVAANALCHACPPSERSPVRRHARLGGPFDCAVFGHTDTV